MCEFGAEGAFNPLRSQLELPRLLLSPALPASGSPGAAGSLQASCPPAEPGTGIPRGRKNGAEKPF